MNGCCSPHRNLHQDYLDLLGNPRVLLNVDRSAAGKAGPAWLHLRVPALLKEYECDLFWAALSLLPYNYRKRRGDVPAMVNFHDLNAFVAPETMVGWNKWQHRLLDGPTLENADRVLCLSGNTKRDILKHFPDTPQEKLAIVYPGCELPSVQALRPEGPVAELSAFMLSVGALEPRKNHETVVEARLKAGRDADLLPLVIVGRKGWGDDALYNRLKSGELESRGIYFLENPSDGVLRWCYEQSAMLAFASLHEGFGLPIIEALQLGKPVLLSDIPIFREIAPADCEFIAPRDVEAWSRALENASRAHRDGGIPANSFDRDFWSWDSRARKLSEIIDELAGTVSTPSGPSENR